VDGESSDWVHVESGVPQGTVLWPVLFLAFINDIPLSVEANVRLFADDCVIYRPVASLEDCTSLQNDLAQLEQ
jgi:ribonuclease P/MRP protein subunit RPP40